MEGVTFLDVLWALALLAVGFFAGFWRGESVNGRKALDYWLTATDGRVNWSRATAAVGLGAFLVLQSTFIRVYVERHGEGLTEALLVMVTSTLAIAGINLGQYYVSKKLPSGNGAVTNGDPLAKPMVSQAGSP